MSAFDDFGGTSWPSLIPSDDPAYAPPTPAIDHGVDRRLLARVLCRLGPVLWLQHRQIPATPAPRVRDGVRIDDPALAALAACQRLTAHSAATATTLREWLCVHDRSGLPQAKLFLLPDTDCLGWDEMLAACRLASVHQPPVRSRPRASFLRGAFNRPAAAWHARIVGFSQRPWPRPDTLQVQAPLRVSMLGLEFARAIADEEDAELLSPFRVR